jgi:hypothetical protein
MGRNDDRRITGPTPKERDTTVADTLGALKIPLVVIPAPGTVKYPWLHRQFCKDPLFFVERIPEEEYGWWEISTSLMKRAVALSDAGHKTMLVVPWTGVAVLRSPDAWEIREILDGRDILFRSATVLMEATPPVEVELSRLGHPTGLDPEVFVASTSGFLNFLNHLVPLRNAGKVDSRGRQEWDVHAFPNKVWHRAAPGGAAESPGFSLRAAFQYLASLLPEQVGIDSEEEFFSREFQIGDCSASDGDLD